MMQKHAFFSRPLTFFGAHQDQEEIEYLEWHFSDFLLDSMHEIRAPHQIKIGLFILWSDGDETDEEIHFS